MLSLKPSLDALFFLSIIVTAKPIITSIMADTFDIEKHPQRVVTTTAAPVGPLGGGDLTTKGDQPTAAVVDAQGCQLAEEEGAIPNEDKWYFSLTPTSFRRNRAAEKLTDAEGRPVESGDVLAKVLKPRRTSLPPTPERP
jgi:hypothetical protein